MDDQSVVRVPYGEDRSLYLLLILTAPDPAAKQTALLTEPRALFDLPNQKDRVLSQLVMGQDPRVALRNSCFFFTTVTVESDDWRERLFDKILAPVGKMYEFIGFTPLEASVAAEEIKLIVLAGMDAYSLRADPMRMALSAFEGALRDRLTVPGSMAVN